MDVRGNGNNRPVRQFPHLVINIADAKAGIDQKAAPGTVQKIAVGFLPMPVFTEDVCIRVNAVYCKPIAHIVGPS
jgi:hypothetical protein